MKEKIRIIILLVIFIVMIYNIKGLVNMETTQKIDENKKESSIDNNENKSINNNIMELTDDNFDSFILSADKKVLIDFYATWCEPCKMLSPIVKEVANENEDVIFARVDVDNCRRLANEFGIQYMPTLVVIENKKEINRSVGLLKKEEIIELLK